MIDAKCVRQFFEHHLSGQTIPYRDQISVRCPSHDDKHASLSVNMHGGVWTCHASCGQGGLIDFEMKASGCDAEQAKANVARIVGADVFSVGKKPEAIHPYRDAQGFVIFEKVRHVGKKFMQRRWTSGGYLYPPADSTSDADQEIAQWVYEAWEWLVRRGCGLTPNRSPSWFKRPKICVWQSRRTAC